eukprot:30908-Pelagococcus_subviridis.AAC.2
MDARRTERKGIERKGRGRWILCYDIILTRRYVYYRAPWSFLLRRRRRRRRRRRLSLLRRLEAQTHAPRVDALPPARSALDALRPRGALLLPPVVRRPPLRAQLQPKRVLLRVERLREVGADDGYGQRDDQHAAKHRESTDALARDAQRVDVAVPDGRHRRPRPPERHDDGVERTLHVFARAVGVLFVPVRARKNSRERGVPQRLKLAVVRRGARAVRARRAHRGRARHVDVAPVRDRPLPEQHVLVPASAFEKIQNRRRHDDGERDEEKQRAQRLGRVHHRPSEHRERAAAELKQPKHAHEPDDAHDAEPDDFFVAPRGGDDEVHVKRHDGDDVHQVQHVLKKLLPVRARPHPQRDFYREERDAYRLAHVPKRRVREIIVVHPVHRLDAKRHGGVDDEEEHERRHRRRPLAASWVVHQIPHRGSHRGVGVGGTARALGRRPRRGLAAAVAVIFPRVHTPEGESSQSRAEARDDPKLLYRRAVPARGSRRLSVALGVRDGARGRRHRRAVAQRPSLRPVLLLSLAPLLLADLVASARERPSRQSIGVSWS